MKKEVENIFFNEIPLKNKVKIIQAEFLKFKNGEND